MSYDEFAREYAAHSAVSPYNALYERPAMQARLGEVRGKRVLDAGCAGGEHTALLLDRGAEVVAMDASAGLIEIVRERFGNRVETHRADLREPMHFLPDASIDVVFCSLTLHYIDDWSVPLREFKRVLRRGGRLLMSTHHPAMTASSVENYFATQLIHETWRVGEANMDVRFYHRPLEAMIGAIIDAGFQVEALIEPHLTARDPSVPQSDYVRLATTPWFIVIEAGTA